MQGAGGKRVGLVKRRQGCERGGTEAERGVYLDVAPSTCEDCRNCPHCPPPQAFLAATYHYLAVIMHRPALSVERGPEPLEGDKRVTRSKGTA